MPELRRLTSQDLDRMQEIKPSELPKRYDNSTFYNVADAFSRVMLGPEWSENDYDRIGDYLPAGLDMFLYSMPVIAVPYTILNADWKGIANSKNSVDAIGRLFETGMPGIFDIIGPKAIDASDYLLPIGAGAIAQTADYLNKKSQLPEIPKPPREPFGPKRIKPSQDALWEIYKP